MVKVTFEDKDNTLILTLKGHAGYAEHGKDIVCASCSILAYTVAQFVKQAEMDGELLTKPTIKLASGDTLISCKPINIHEMMILYRYAEVGYSLLKHNYPQYVDLTPFE